jgi:hypothetical protein
MASISAKDISGGGVDLAVGKGDFMVFRVLVGLVGVLPNKDLDPCAAGLLGLESTSRVALELLLRNGDLTWEC